MTNFNVTPYGDSSLDVGWSMCHGEIYMEKKFVSDFIESASRFPRRDTDIENGSYSIGTPYVGKKKTHRNEYNFKSKRSNSINHTTPKAYRVYRYGKSRHFKVQKRQKSDVPESNVIKVYSGVVRLSM
jgi:hypothetical protein